MFVSINIILEFQKTKEKEKFYFLKKTAGNRNLISTHDDYTVQSDLCFSVEAMENKRPSIC